MAFTLFSSASSGTGSVVEMAEAFDMGMMVYVPSGAYTSMKLVGSISGQESPFSDLSCFPVSSTVDTRQIVITPANAGLYFYPYVGGLSVRAQVTGVAAGTVVVKASAVKK